MITRRRQRASADALHLDGPSDPTLTPPPRRRTRLIIVSSLIGLLVIGLVGLAAIQADLFANAVQAFVGRN